MIEGTDRIIVTLEEHRATPLARPRFIDEEDSRWFDHAQRDIFHVPTISEKIINSVDTGHKKVYCAGTIFDKTGFYHQPAFLFSRVPHDGAFLKPDFDAIPRLDGKFVAVADQSSTRNFFHWFAETIPAL